MHQFGEGAVPPGGAGAGMLVHVALGFVRVVVSVVLHGLGTLVVIDRLAGALRRGGRGRFAAGLLTIRVVSCLLLLHLVEASAWAVLYWLARATPEAEAAFYFS